MTFKELYKELVDLREQLKYEFYANGRTPTICSDEALRELAKQAPRHKEDLYNITGLGEVFVNKYGDYFMDVLKKYHDSNISTVELNDEIKATLKNLENRLVNISKHNRLLYMGKLYNKHAFDLTTNDRFNNDIINLLFGKKQSLKLCKISNDAIETEKRLKRIVPLLREVTKDLRENGQYDLYVGYPFVEGKIKGENFNVRAPLVLFPIIFNKEDEEIIIQLDKSKDILFNNNLILLQNKFLFKYDELPNNVFENVTKDDFYEQIKLYYSDNGIELIDGKDIFNLSLFNDFKANEFPPYFNGEFHIVPNAVLGKFSLYSSALQKDFKDMIDDTEISELLDNLLSSMDDVDAYSDRSFLEVDEDDKTMKFSEQNLNYINELNSSQEQAILTIDREDKLVIQGPPGTGKSQTIASLIADTVNKGHNVLMVSQKKAALDVIYSRLGNLSNFAIQLSDVKDKESFYKQLNQLFLEDKNIRDIDDNLKNQSLNIDEQIKYLESIADRLYTSKTNGIEMYKIYQANDSNLFKTKQTFENIFYDKMPKDLFSLDYIKLVSMKDKFTNELTLQNTLNYYDIISKLPFITDINNNFTNYDVKQMEKDFNAFAIEQKKYLKKNFIVKIFTHKNRKNEINKLYEKYFYKNDSKKYIYKNPLLLNETPSVYLTFQDAKLIFETLNDDERIYSKAIFEINKEHLDINVNDYLYDFIIYCIIDKFEHRNNDILANIYNFDSIIEKITKAMQRKKDLTKDKLRNTLINAFYDEIHHSKRYNEMHRQIESSRKWSISKFI